MLRDPFILVPLPLLCSESVDTISESDREVDSDLLDVTVRSFGAETEVASLAIQVEWYCRTVRSCSEVEPFFPSYLFHPDSVPRFG